EHTGQEAAFIQKILEEKSAEDRIVILGGDGTISLTLNALPDDPEEFEQLMTDFFGRVEDLKQNGGTMADTSTTETKETQVEN
ncbi:diacylglycerol kinase family protein, partial [Lactococcus petauri]|uniref:diacylglycerol kinase family protein n=1 Tax=Lactococcus petauri TaxID=1940789 RepID=UPI0025500065